MRRLLTRLTDPVLLCGVALAVYWRFGDPLGQLVLRGEVAVLNAVGSLLTAAGSLLRPLKSLF